MYRLPSPRDPYVPFTIGLTTRSCASYDGAVKTLDGLTTLQCLFVGLTDENASRCAAALRPIKAVRIEGIKEACARMSSVLPLVVVVAKRFGDPLLGELLDVANSCAAEVIEVEDEPPEDLEKQLTEALRRADRRRS